MSRRLILVFALLAGVLTPALPAQAGPTAEPAAVAQELLVAFKVGTSEVAKAAALARANSSKISSVVRGTSDQNDVDLVRFPATVSSSAAIRALQANPNVLYAEPNWILTTDATSNDPYYTGGSLWGMYGDNTTPKNTFGTHAGEAWANDKLGSKNSYIGIIDEGIDFSHPDLNSNIWVNPYDPVNGRDDDGNGYIDDVRGWDFVNNNNTIYDGGTLDRHGTHVAGTIGASGNNGQGVAGVSWNVTMISGKFLGANGGSLANAVKAVNYFTDLKTRHGLKIVATSNSWGGGGYSVTLHQAIIRAAKANILFIAAAGNDGLSNDTTARYPSSYNSTVAAVSSGTTIETAATYDNVIAVAAIASDGTLASFSNYGANSVDIGAPGVGVWSTLPGNTYASYNGTSMATPHVSGAAALINADTGLIGAGLRNRILSSVTTYAGLTGRVSTGGRLDLSSFGPGAVDASAPSISLSASSTSVVAGSTVTLTATATDNVGVTRVDFNQGVTLLGSDSSNPYTYVWTAATAGTYQFTSTGFDAANNSSTSNSVTVTVTAPTDSTPPSISLAASSNSITAGASVTLTATASDNVGVTQVEFYQGATLLGTDTSAPFVNNWSTSSAGTYQFTSIAYDAASNSTTSNTVTVNVAAAADSTPPTVSLVSSSSSVAVGSSITLTASANDNVAVTSVEIYVNGNLISTLSSGPYTLDWTALSAGTYSFTAIAYDAAGLSATSAAVTVTATNPVATGVRASSVVITFYGGKASNSNLGVNVITTNNLGATVANARVSITVQNITTGATASASGTTNSSGQVTFAFKNPPAGTYTADVTNIVATGLAFINDDTCTPVQRPA